MLRELAFVDGILVRRIKGSKRREQNSMFTKV